MIDAELLAWIGAFGEQRCKLVRGFDGFGIILRSSDDNAAWMQIVVQSMAFAQEFGGEKNAIVI